MEKINLLLIETIFDSLIFSNNEDLELLKKEILSKSGIIFYTSGFTENELNNVLDVLIDLKIISVDLKVLLSSSDDIYRHLMLMNESSYFLSNIINQLLAERNYSSNFSIKNEEKIKVTKNQPTLF